MQLCDSTGPGMRVSGVWHATLTHLGVVDVDVHRVHMHAWESVRVSTINSSLASPDTVSATTTAAITLQDRTAQDREPSELDWILTESM
jgi:hypothetical protein